MKFFLPLFVLIATSAHAMDLDIYGSNFRATNSTEFVLENVRSKTFPGKNWGRFQWNPQANAFVLVDMGAMTPTAAGRWDLFFDVNCSGDRGRTTWLLNTDGSGISGENRTFRWTMTQQNDFVLTYTSGGRVTYTGRFSGGALAGNFSSPDGSFRGCWNAVKMQRQNFAPNKPDTRTGRDSSGQ